MLWRTDGIDVAVIQSLVRKGVVEDFVGNEHLDSLANQLSGKTPHLIVLRGGMGRKQRDAAAAEIASVSNDVGRVLIVIRSNSGNSLQSSLLLTAEEFDEAFDEIADMVPHDIPPPSDTALRRENLDKGEV